jgi:hypothetical protein
MDNGTKKVEISPIVSFPSQNAPFEEKKTQEWGRMLAQSLESDWFFGFNQGNFLASQFNLQRRDFLQRRLYAKGLQSMDKYKEQFKADGDKSFLNLSTKPITIIPKLVDIVVNGMADRGYSIRATSIDPIGYTERLAYREQIENDRLSKDIIVKAKETFGVDIGTMPVDQLPETDEELNLHMDLEYKQSIEISQELAIEEVLAANRYNDKIDRLNKKGLTIDGVAWVKHRFVPNKGILVEWVDAMNKIHSYTEDPYFSDCFYHGEFKTVPLSEVYTDYQWLNQPENADIKKQVEYSADGWWEYNLTPVNEQIKGTCNLLYFTYKTTRPKRKTIKTKATGERKIMKGDFNWKPNASADFKDLYIEEEVLFEGVYVLGTGILLKWEVAENMVRPKSNKQKVMDQYIGVAPNMERGYIDSPVARMIPVEDQLNIIQLKAEQIIQKIMPDGFIIDPDAIAELQLGGGNVLTVQNVVDMFWQTGSIFARSFGASGDPLYSKPITELRTGDSLSKLQALTSLKAQYMDQMRDVIGLNRASDASSPDKDSLVGVQKLAALNSNIATRHVLDGAGDVTKRLAEAITYRTHDLLKYSPLKEDFARKIGATAVKTLESIKDLHLHDFAIFLDLHLDDEQRAKLENDMTIAIEKGMLSVADKYKVLNIKNFKLALAYMTILMNKYQKKAQEQKLEEFKAQSDANAQSAERAEAARQQTVQMTAQFEMQQQQLINQGLLEKEKLKGSEDRLSLEMKINGDMAIAQLNGQVAMNKFNELENRKDDRTRMQASQQSQLITQRQRDENPKDFEKPEEFEMFKLD